MPLPASNTQWPPAHLTEAVLPKLAEWDAWYVGDPARLAGAPSGSRPSIQSDGLLGVIRTFFWGKPTTMALGKDNRLHVPVASDIAQASADLLFSEAPKVTTEEAAQERLDLIAGDEFHEVIAGAAEVSAALGGTYLVATTDPSADAAFITRMDADRAAPVFQWGRLQSVTFWTILPHDGADTLRYLEVHELDAAGIGVIRHGLFRGNMHSLGNAVPLNEHPVTAPLATTVDDEATTTTGTPGLDVVYIPNLGPNRRWRNHPAGKHMGRSDLDGLEALMDALDEVYSSLMRDVRLGKAMLVVPNTMLTNNGAGKGADFEQDEIYSGVNAAPGSVADAKLAIEMVQFKIRVEEHLATASDLFAKILRSAGYSAQTFGEGDNGPAATATEITSRERRSYITRDRKIRAFKPGLQKILTKALAMDAIAYTKPSPTKPIVVTFGDSIQDSALSLAQTAQALRAAEAASTKTLVQMQHPDWDDKAIDDEVALIVADRGAPFADPDTMGEDGADLPDAFGQDNDAEV